MEAKELWFGILSNDLVTIKTKRKFKQGIRFVEYEIANRKPGQIYHESYFCEAVEWKKYFTKATKAQKVLYGTSKKD